MVENKRAPLGEILLAASKVWQAVKAGSSIDSALRKASSEIPTAFRPAVQSLVYQVARKRALVKFLVDKLAAKKPTPEVSSYLEIALAIALEGNEKPFVLVNEAVNGAKRSRNLKNSANFINAVLRRFLREKETLTKEALLNPSVRFNAPEWWIRKYKKVFKNADAIMELQQRHPPLVLRVNQRRISRDDYLAQLHQANIEAHPVGEVGVALVHAMAASQIPGLQEGLVSVQDAGSQLASQILGVKDGMKVLDCCAAPGGKTGHLLELADIDLVALEMDPERAEKIKENLDRLGLHATVLVADASDMDIDVQHREFDRILLDAPCSASGVVRRHPDIPWLKNQEDINNLAQKQKELLEKNWLRLAKGGRILYAVCSVMPEEGMEQIRNFLQEKSDARLVSFEGALDGYLLLAPQEKTPTEGFMPWVNDGFFYALIEKI
ncbi:MAG: 16S rRNA (cytosine(967)-C(5))-methyltransferase RsmB [Burkholderiales bacterium]|nr:16S rRNA (cytosine(967)-C(5))-methyltransferase RsmB [Burkholderiales bacterium]